MKFLAICKPKDSLTMLTPAVTRPLTEAAFAFMNQSKKAGKLLEYYYSPAGCIIVMLNYNTAEEWVKEQFMMPILNYYSQEIYPLSNGDEAMKGVIESLKAAEKMMAGTPK